MLCYYITGHGFGHAIRTTQILKALPSDVPLILKTTAPERLFREELPGRDFEYLSAEYDCGCLQSDSVTVLKRETLTRYAQIANANASRIPDEIAFLKSRGVCCVASDVPSFPLSAAHQAGIPALAVANFTWHDIYAEYAETPQDEALLAQMAAEYASATLACLTPLALPTVGDVFPESVQVPLVVRRGSFIQPEFVEAFGIPNKKRLALLYLGNWGLDVDWASLQRWHNWEFLVDRPLPVRVSNVTVFDPQQWRYADVAASVSAVVSKAGYGTLSECIANGVPLIYLPRHGFAEHQALVQGMERWGGGVEISEGDFFAGNWGNALNSALSASLNSAAYATNGAEVIAERVMRYCR